MNNQSNHKIFNHIKEILSNTLNQYVLKCVEASASGKSFYQDYNPQNKHITIEAEQILIFPKGKLRESCETVIKASNEWFKENESMGVFTVKEKVPLVGIKHTEYHSMYDPILISQINGDKKINFVALLKPFKEVRHSALIMHIPSEVLHGLVNRELIKIEKNHILDKIEKTRDKPLKSNTQKVL